MYAKNAAYWIYIHTYAQTHKPHTLIIIAGRINFLCLCVVFSFVFCLCYINWPWIYVQNAPSFRALLLFADVVAAVATAVFVVAIAWFPPKQLYGCVCARARERQEGAVISDDNNCLTVFPFISHFERKHIDLFFLFDDFPFGNQAASGMERYIWVNKCESRIEVERVVCVS